ncbi:hypothetical protein DTL21_24070 [Bremerella cremea]|uniref:Uncharacterized protein n=1 Tax=Blastopirellula marina TaxID=124 RepID=A0A2S8FET4_9BACT|nr:hypothetical protein C5Y83_24025 [Blastopirellula marina]RCS43787.1 hypothetical protein DTL21_24070 [Bremerella cremea]
MSTDSTCEVPFYSSITAIIHVAILVWVLADAPFCDLLLFSQACILGMAATRSRMTIILYLIMTMTAYSIWSNAPKGSERMLGYSLSEGACIAMLFATTCAFLAKLGVCRTSSNSDARFSLHDAALCAVSLCVSCGAVANQLRIDADLGMASQRGLGGVLFFGGIGITSIGAYVFNGLSRGTRDTTILLMLLPATGILWICLSQRVDSDNGHQEIVGIIISQVAFLVTVQCLLSAPYWIHRMASKAGEADM